MPMTNDAPQLPNEGIRGVSSEKREESLIEAAALELERSVIRLEKSLALDRIEKDKPEQETPIVSKVDSLARHIVILANRVNSCANETEKL